ncbi:MAG: AAA family ATPase [Gemmatimonadetes bacterium]|nr:AAA family ATPase [Gemmatimonadota bacterium]NIO30626.1 AAA family ATPase [Gemmatimonadota bacterium]
MSNSWSGPRRFVGRTAVRDALACEVDAAITQGGRAVFLLGAAGSGQTALISVFQEEAFRRYRELRAQYVDCAQSGARTWADLAEVFTRRHRLKRTLQKVYVDWLESVPIAGKILQAVMRTVTAIRTGRVVERSREPLRSAHDSALAAVRLLLEFEPLEPRLVIMDSLDRGDSEDLAGAAALIRHLPETRTLFLAAVRTEDGRPPEAIADLILEAERLKRAVRVDLPPLADDEVGEIVTAATRGRVPADWLRWIISEAQGNPATLWSTLGSLEEEGRLRKTGRRWVWEGTPAERDPSASRAVPAREWALSDEDRRLAGLAACEGPLFHSAVLAVLAGLPELEVEDRLSRLCRVGLFEYRCAPAAGGDVTSQYAFRDSADALAFADSLPEAERADVAARIERIRRELGL